MLVLFWLRWYMDGCVLWMFAAAQLLLKCLPSTPAAAAVLWPGVLCSVQYCVVWSSGSCILVRMQREPSEMPNTQSDLARWLAMQAFWTPFLALPASVTHTPCMLLHACS